MKLQCLQFLFFKKERKNWVYYMDTLREKAANEVILKGVYYPCQAK